MNGIASETERTPTVVILGAGRPYQGDLPSGLNVTPDQRHIVDCLTDAFNEIQAECHFVVGYHADEFTASHPRLSYSFNPDWENSGSVGSLFAAPLNKRNPLFVSYSDIIFTPEVVRSLAETEGDVVIAMDQKWQSRYERRTRQDIAAAEKVVIHKNMVVGVGKRYLLAETSAEFIGLVKFSPKAIAEIIKLRENEHPALSKQSIPALIEKLISLDCHIVGVDVNNHWAELNAPQDIASFYLGTKAQTLERVRPLLKKSQISEQVAFTVGEWNESRKNVLDRIQETFEERALVIRSSALSEDSWDSANAGAFDSVLDVPGHEPEMIVSGIEQVIGSYGDDNPEHQVLVQNMLKGVIASGVVFTRTLSHGAPYYMINYDETSSTDTVTSGTGEDLKMLVVHRAAKNLPQDTPAWCSRLLDALKEIEVSVGHDSLDIEFAVTGPDEIHIFQMRPIAVDHSEWRVSSSLVNTQLGHATQTFIEKQNSGSFLLGKRTMFGVMPDWNPAEIIGTKPAALAISLYRFLVTDEIWATQRAEYGYRDVRPQPLLTCFAGHPYIDIRASFNSFIPKDIPEDLAKRLVEYYLDHLEENPSLHDKVEFDVLFTCWTFDFEAQSIRLKDAGFTDHEISMLKAELGKVTRHGFERYETDLTNIDTLEKRFQKIMNGGFPPLERACALLEDCRRYGTLPFAHLARGAFVAVSLLKSAVGEGLFDKDFLNNYLQSISTVSKQFVTDAFLVSSGQLEWELFVKKYGHLRPGTYEITSLSYMDDPERYLRPTVETAREQGKHAEVAAEWNDDIWEQLGPRLKEAGLPDNRETFDQFIRKVIEGREYGKFVFSRNLSAALDAFAEFGESYGISRETLSHIPVEDFFNLRVGIKPSDLKRWIKERAESNRRRYAISQSVELPPMLAREEDLWSFFMPDTEPNYIGTGQLTSEIVIVDQHEKDVKQLTGKIAVIPRADPGFDWLFGYGIKGLITAYGGANSHMAIRAAEFNMPAVIGLGEKRYNQLLHAKVVEIDCQQRWLRVVQ